MAIIFIPIMIIATGNRCPSKAACRRWISSSASSSSASSASASTSSAIPVPLCLFVSDGDHLLVDGRVDQPTSTTGRGALLIINILKIYNIQIILSIWSLCEVYHIYWIIIIISLSIINPRPQKGETHSCREKKVDNHKETTVVVESTFPCQQLAGPTMALVRILPRINANMKKFATKFWQARGSEGELVSEFSRRCGKGVICSAWMRMRWGYLLCVE